MHISYRNSEPEVIVTYDDADILIEALTDLRAVKNHAMNTANDDLRARARTLHRTERLFTERDFGIDKIDAMIATLNEVL